MRNTGITRFWAGSLILLIFSLTNTLSAQTRIPVLMDTATIDDQLQYINDRTRIYENYRAIREDIFQKIRNNTLDSLNGLKEQVISVQSSNKELDETITGLNNRIELLESEKESAISNRDSLMFFGMQMTKSAYNKLLWTIITVLLALTVIVFLLFKRSNSVTKLAKKDLGDIKKEFEEFRRVAHENKEKLIVGHFNEIKKLRGMGR
jgi:hypothetical protein